MDFEWDPAKADGNLAKHGIDFDDAINVFYDPMMVSERDPRDYDGEIRYRAIGVVSG